MGGLSWRDWVFSGKALLAGLLALYLALAFDLSRPYWALTAVYIVSSPFSGATRSRAIYRVLGTFLGASAAVFVVPVFVNSPELLSLVVALWTGTLLFLSMLDRSARSYVFMLAGYTMPMIALPAVSDPTTVFDIALARSEEITLGIICASVVTSIVFPFSLNSVFSSRIDGWLRDAGAWADEILRGEGAIPVTPLKRQKLAADVNGLDLLISQLSFDPGTMDLVNHAKELRGRFLLLLPAFSSMADRLHAVKLGCTDLPPDLVTLLHDIAAWVKQGAHVGAEEAGVKLLARIDAHRKSDSLDGWDALMFTGLMTRLRDVVELWFDCLVLRNTIAAGRAAAKTRTLLSSQPVLSAARHFDHALLAIKVTIVITGILASIGVWVALGWNEGSAFVTMTAVAASFYAAQDRPTKGIRTMAEWSVLSVIGAFVYVFGILPMATSFEMLALALAPFMIFLGLRMTNPLTGSMPMLLTVQVATLVGIQDRYSADLQTLVNGGIATVLGVVFAYVWVSIAHPFGAEFAARRLLKAGWRDLADAAAGLRASDADLLAGRILDRLGQLVPRLATIEDRELKKVDGFADVRLGFNVIRLQEGRKILSSESAEQVSTILIGVAEHYRNQAKAGGGVEPPLSLRESIDKGINAIKRNDGDEALGAIDALVGLRRVLFPEASPPDLRGPAETPSFSLAAE